MSDRGPNSAGFAVYGSGDAVRAQLGSERPDIRVIGAGQPIELLKEAALPATALDAGSRLTSCQSLFTKKRLSSGDSQRSNAPKTRACS